MEIANFPSLRCHHCYQHCNKIRRSFVQLPRQSGQRLIPLTEEIVKVMADFNVSPSDTSLPDKQLYSTLSITSLVREEVQNILHEISISERFIRMEEIDKLIDKCLKEKVAIMRETKDKSPSGDAANEDVSANDLNKKCRNKVITANIQVLEQRITNLEKRLSFMIQTMPIMDTNKFKINSNMIKDKVRLLTENQEKETGKRENEPSPAQSLNSTSEGQLKVKARNAYNDNLLCEIRENILNLINYRKSLTTLKLNEKVYFNPNVKPIISTLPEPRQKTKQVTTFIINRI